MNHTFLYRAVCLENVDHEFTGEPQFWIGMSLGRGTGYLSRSSAKDAGERSGVKYTILRSLPVLWVVPEVVSQAEHIVELEERLAMVTPIRGVSA